VAVPSTCNDVREALRGVQIHPRIIEEFRPICESLEWRLSDAYWQTTGVRGFLNNDVPYTVNNSGWLSVQCAELLFANCMEVAPGQHIAVLEVGAGTGLFARYLLDEFHELCAERGKDYYERLTFYVSDGSPATVQQWAEFGIFNDHGSHVVTGVCDARHPDRFQTSDGRTVPLPALRAVFANYVLDSLPATVLRKGAEGPEEQYVRTHLGEPDRVAQYTRWSVDEIRALAAASDPSERSILATLSPALEFESEFRPVNGRVPWVDEAMAFGRDVERIVLNHGAFEALEQLTAMLEPGGFALVNDYGAISADQIAAQAGTQRFGPSAAVGLNFPLLEHHFTMRRIKVTAPERDDLMSVHPRLLSSRDLPETRAAFARVFDGRIQKSLEEIEDEARKHVEAGRADRARDAYDRALSLRKRDWRLFGEVAEFAIRVVRDYESGLRLARAALASNPWYSVWLWNVLGDALFALERYDEAHDAYLTARRMEPGDVRTALNLAYTHTQFAEYGPALASIASGLEHDTTGLFRQRLLEKQQHILTLSSQRAAAEQEWQARRMQRLAQ
jgi:tetratricopeptide (TPR) repeat protein